MKKLAILALLVVAGCRRQVVVTNAPPAQQQPVSAVNAPGGATPREAIQKFMAAAKAQDVQGVSRVWGTAKGPAQTDRTYMTVEVMEQRIVVMLRCLRHDSYVIKSETPVSGGGRSFNVELRLGNNLAAADFATVPGPDSRHFVSSLDLPKLSPICGAP